MKYPELNGIKFTIPQAAIVNQPLKLIPIPYMTSPDTGLEVEAIQLLQDWNKNKANLAAAISARREKDRLQKEAFTKVLIPNKPNHAASSLTELHILKEEKPDLSEFDSLPFQSKDDEGYPSADIQLLTEIMGLHTISGPIASKSNALPVPTAFLGSQSQSSSYSSATSALMPPRIIRPSSKRDVSTEHTFDSLCSIGYQARNVNKALEIFKLDPERLEFLGLLQEITSELINLLFEIRERSTMNAIIGDLKQLVDMGFSFDQVSDAMVRFHLRKADALEYLLSLS